MSSPSGANAVTAVACLPVLLAPYLALLDPEGPQLGSLSQGALQFGEPAEASERHHMVPQHHCIVWTRQPTDHRTKQGRALGEGRVITLNGRLTVIGST